MRYALFLLAAAIAVPAAAAPDVPAPAAGEQTAEQKPKKAKKICRANQDSTSRMGAGRLCLTAAQWAERDKSGVAGSSRSGRSAKVDD